MAQAHDSVGVASEGDDGAVQHSVDQSEEHPAHFAVLAAGVLRRQPTRPNLLVLVRHGQSERNVARRGNTFFPDDESRQGLRGEPDQRTPLTDLGTRQARDAGQRGRQNDQHLPERVAHRSPRVGGVI